MNLPVMSSVFNIPTRTPTKIPATSPFQPKSHLRYAATPYPQKNTQGIGTSATQNQVLDQAISVQFQALSNGKLGISRFPDFEYNAGGGKGTGIGRRRREEDQTNIISVVFDVQTLNVPDLTSATTRFLGLPLPPFLKIEVVPKIFEGIIEENTGKVELEFTADFCFSIGSIYRAPPLVVKTVLTSEESRGVIRKGRGERLDEDGKCRLVGVANVDPIDDIFLNSFLGLPTECLADLNAKIIMSSSGDL